jgi:Co/Zn/Cd efflux system component
MPNSASHSPGSDAVEGTREAIPGGIALVTAGKPNHHHAHHSHNHFHDHGHSHTHGAVDPEIAASEQGLWAVKWSFVGLVITAIAQAIVFALSGSVALMADLIHNVGDAMTSVPLGVAFLLARAKPSPRFAYGYGRSEDLAGWRSWR